MAIKIFHLSAECYPAAKVGGLADVVGALPKYQRQLGAEASVIMPKYNTKWLNEQTYKHVFEGQFLLDEAEIAFEIKKEVEESRGFPLYVVDIPRFFDRAGIYGDPDSSWVYTDEAERYISFQRAALQWIDSLAPMPDTVHCHDHHTGLIPFMMTQCPAFKRLESIPTVLTVHNAEYQGAFPHDKEALLPEFDPKKSGLLDWSWQLNSLAAGLKCSWQITTVSPSYMRELQHRGGGLELLFAHEKQKSRGILNGIDTSVWNPETDEYLTNHYSVNTIEKGKAANKKELCEQFGFKEKRPMVSFIGRLVDEKGADLLPELFAVVLDEAVDVSFLVLGTGQQDLHRQFENMSNEYVGYFDASLSYNEQLAHQIYAGSDFMIMPSRVEPCGLNQMYAMRYGTIPIVRNVGGLKDTVRDVSEPSGYGLKFDGFNLEEAKQAVIRALKLYQSTQKMKQLRQKNAGLDFSWNVSAKAYINMYKQLIDRL